MSRIDRSSLIARPSVVVFDLVNEVAAYPGAFNWCRAANVLERDEASMLARLDLTYAGFQSSFTTRNRFERPRRIDLELVEGPFSSLRGAWTFTALGEHGCRVNLHLDFEMAGRFVGSALALGFQGLADRMVDDFARVARSLPEAADAR
ncbi:MAG: type II toxin-antitoxin system RatA family toxin [Xanthomonadales bacterium]|nr:type II toxin-antitoxin system RatA family toxin [Xanthomonadales bacterium]